MSPSQKPGGAPTGVSLIRADPILRAVVTFGGATIAGIALALASHFVTAIVAPSWLRDGQYRLWPIMFYYLGTLGGTLAIARVWPRLPGRPWVIAGVGHAIGCSLGLIGSWAVPVALVAILRRLAD